MKQKSPEGYGKLLVYQKAVENHEAVLQLTRHIPDNIRTHKDLRGHLDTSARSVPKNIREGWKRRTTDEYLTFIGYAEASNDEVMGDAEDIAVGKYIELKGIKGLMGLMGEKGEKGFYKREELEKFRFYPISESLPPVVRVYLRAKQIDYLLHKLKKSLDQKMDDEFTRTRNDRFSQRIQQDRAAQKGMEKIVRDTGLIRLIDGRFIGREEYNERIAAGEKLELDPEWGKRE